MKYRVTSLFRAETREKKSLETRTQSRHVQSCSVYLSLSLSLVYHSALGKSRALLRATIMGCIHGTRLTSAMLSAMFHCIRPLGLFPLGSILRVFDCIMILQASIKEQNCLAISRFFQYGAGMYQLRLGCPLAICHNRMRRDR